jgi:hypothetical protein
MRIIRFTSVLALLLMTCVTAGAQQYAKGSYQFSFGDRYTKYVEFDAQTLEKGGATGRMFLSDEAPISLQDPDGEYKDRDGEGPVVETIKGFYITAEFDDMSVEKNRAVMSGTIRDASIKELIGQQVLLTVEDNADNPREPDKLTWGIYQNLKRDWTPADAEWKEDPGAGLRWWATDAERKDDVGYAMPKDERVTLQSYPLAAYLFVDTEDGVGDIFVQP